ncbi:MAG: exodeoxyribonuclease VII small subunit [Acidobacteriota bacterium]
MSTDPTTGPIPGPESASPVESQLEGEKLSFSDALQQLEEILGRIEDERIDIDELATELRRGAGLLDLCRGKIRRAELEVTQIVQRLEDSDEG